MSDEKTEGLPDSVFSKPTKQKGYFEKPDPTTPETVAPQPTSDASSANNPFSTGTNVSPTPEPSDSLPPAVPESTDANVFVTIEPGYLTASILVTPPSGEGQPLTKEMVHDALSAAKVVFGLQHKSIDEALKPTYGTSIVVARGVAAQNGEDGACTELYPRIQESTFIENPDGTVNYKELGKINDLPTGTVICTVTPPSAGQNGTNIYGVEIKPLSGKKIVLPIGKGTHLTEDGSQIVTTVSGNLAFRDGHFTVDEVFEVQNVDYDIGNITFSGHVRVKGDMQDGFEIHAGGNITLGGRAGSTVLVAGGDIRIEQGINGNGKAEITTSGTLTAGFIENCSIRSVGDVMAGSIINSTVECENNVDVTQKRGIICGGKITAMGSIKAKEIGNESNTPTFLTVGITPRLLTERKKYSDRLADVSKNIDDMMKNTQYIERLLEQQKPVPPERIQLLQRTKMTLPILNQKRDQLKASIEEIELKMASATGSTVQAKVIYSPTRINIGTLTMSIPETRTNVKAYVDQAGEITIGTM